MASFLPNTDCSFSRSSRFVAASSSSSLTAASVGRKASHEGLEVENLNKKYKTLGDTLARAVSSKERRKKQAQRPEERSDKAKARRRRRDRAVS